MKRYASRQFLVLMIGLASLYVAPSLLAGQREGSGGVYRDPASREINQIVSEYLNQAHQEMEIRKLRQQTETLRQSATSYPSQVIQPDNKLSDSYGIVEKPEETAVTSDPIFNRRPEPVRETIPSEFNERIVKDAKREPSQAERIQEFVKSFKERAFQAGYEVEVDMNTLEVTKIAPRHR